MVIKGELLKRVQEAGIVVEEIKLNQTSNDGTTFVEGRSIAKFPCGRDFKVLRFGTHSITEGDFLNSKFEHFKFVKDYEAIWSATESVIEGKIEIVSRDMLGNRYSFLKLSRGLGFHVEDDNAERITYHHVESNYIVSIGFASQEFAVLYPGTFGRIRNLEAARRLVTIRIENIELKTHDQAQTILVKIANSLLFKIDLTTDVSFKLANDEIWIPRAIREYEYIKDFSFPSYEYDTEPMSLYWYAKSATEMPLLRFLALYQILEFYFPTFSRKDAHLTIQNIIKDPRFDPNRDSDVTKILTSITSNKNQIGFGNELDQLKATMAYCLSGSDIRELILNDAGLNEYYSGKDVKKMASKLVNVNSGDSDLISDCAERIYEIRCRVVHTKASDKTYKLLLPSSPELKYLKFDTTLLETIAKKVLVSSSRTLKI